jgi:hypothetical protein
VGPSLLLDKSAFESLSRDEHLFLFGHYVRVLPPVLVVEVIADLTKEDPSAKSPEALVARLAGKFVGSGPPLHVGHTLLLRNDLLAADIVMDGRCYPAGAILVPDRGHGPGMFVDVSPTNEAIFRWGHGEFRDSEREIAQAWRDAKIPFPQSELEASLARRGVVIPMFKDLEVVNAWVAATLENHELSALWLDWLMVKGNLSAAARVGVGERWLRERKSLAEFSPYGHHCMKVDLTFMAANQSRLIPDRPTNLIDVQYLYYTPFCNSFVSNDRVHRALAPPLLRADQDFADSETLRAEIRKQSGQT